MGATLEELLAEQQRRAQLAPLLAEQQRRADVAPPALAVPELPPDTPPERPAIPEVQAQRVLEQAEARGAEAEQAMREVTERPAVEIREQETARALREIEAEREKVVVPGVKEPVTFEPAGPAVFRPTRIVETAEGRFYRDPETGELSEPTLGEEVRESFALQTLTGEEEARRLAAAGVGDPKGILGTRESGSGIVETTFGSLLRSIPGYAEAAVGEAYFRGLGYEVDAEGHPVDPDDFGLALKEMREKLGLPAVVHSPGLGLVALPLPGVATTQRVAMKMDPEGRRKVSTVEVPSPLDDPAGFLEAEARRIAQNVAAGRTLGDEFRDAPELAAYYERVWDDPDYAYWAGTLASLPIPILGGASAVAKSLAASAKNVVPLTELVKKADEAAIAAKTAQAQLAAEAGPDAMRSAARRLESAKLSLIEAGGDSFANAGALAGVGRRGEERVAQRVVDLVVKGSELTDAQKAAVLERLASGVGRSGPEAADAVRRAVLAEQAPKVARTGPKSRPWTLEDGTTTVISPTTEQINEMAKWAHEGLNPHVASWTLRNDHTSKQKIFDAYNQLEQGERAALAFQVEDLVEAATGGEYLTVYRVMSQGDDPAKMGGASVSSNPEWAQKGAQAFKVHHSDILLHHGQSKLPNGSELGSSRGVASYADEQEIILRPTATRVEPLGAAEDIKEAVSDLEEIANKMHRQTLLNVPDDFVMVTETRAAPRAIAGDVRRVMQARTKQAVDAEGEAFLRLTPDEKAVRVAAIQDEIADEVSAGLSRRTSELTDLQVRTHDATRRATDLARYRPFDTPTGRRLRVLSPGFKLDQVTAGARALGGKLSRAGKDAGRQVSRELARLSKAEGSVARGLDRMMREQVEQTARAMGEDPEAVASAMWDKVLEGIVTPVKGGTSQVELQKFMRRTVDTSEAPTVARVQGLEAAMVEPEAGLKFAGQGKRFTRRADVQRAMLRSLMEEGIKKQLGPDRASYEALRQGLGDDLLGPSRGSVEELLIDKRAQDAAVAMAREVPVSVLPRTKYRVPYATGKTQLEEKLANNAAELVDQLPKIEPRLRRNYAQVLGDALKWLAVPGRHALVQRAKYGYGIPNLPFMVYKGLETPFIAASQLGAARTLASLPRAGRSFLQRLTRRHMTGGGITTAEGVYYSPEELLRLGEVEGVMTAVDAERRFNLTDDILAAARRASKETPVRSRLSPFEKGFWTRTAEAMEKSYRQGIFEAELIAGATPTAAARAARQGALDYDEIPEAVKAVIEPMFPAAGTTYKLARAVIVSGLKNPGTLAKSLRVLREHQRRQDPANIAGDSSIANIVVGDDDFSAYLPIPGVSQLVTALEVARHGSNLMTDLAQGAAAARATGRSTPAVWLERVGDDVVPLAWTLADAAFPVVLNAYEQFETVSAALPEKQQKTANEDAAMWAAAMWAHNADPEHDDAWKTFQQIFQWREVEPPGERAVPGREGYWRTVPPGLPHVAVRDIETGDIMYKVLELTDTGRENLGIISAMTPESIERAIPTASAMLQGTESAFSEQAPIIKRIYVPSEIDTWKEAIITQLLNPTGIDFSDPEGVRKAQAQRVLEIRAPSE